MADINTATQFDVGELLRGIIISDANMASKVGSRVYPGELPDTTSYEPDSADLPAIHYSLVDDSEHYRVPISRSTWQLTVITNTQAELQSTCGALKELFNRYKSGRIRYIAYVNSSTEWDTETKTPYAPMTFRVTLY